MGLFKDWDVTDLTLKRKVKRRKQKKEKLKKRKEPANYEGRTYTDYLEYKIQNEKFYITFITKKWEFYGRVSQLVDDAKITYEVDKDFYYDFKNSYSTEESESEIELVKNLTEKFDPVSVINPEGKIQEVK